MSGNITLIGYIQNVTGLAIRWKFKQHRMYNWNFRPIEPYTIPLLKGLLVTLWISFVSIVLGTVIGIFLAAVRKAPTKFIRYPAIVFIEVFLAMPILVLLIWVYYCLSLSLNIKLSAMTTTILVFSCSLSAFIAETLKLGVEAVPKGQIEAGLSLQLSKFNIYRFIILPQAFQGNASRFAHTISYMSETLKLGVGYCCFRTITIRRTTLFLKPIVLWKYIQ